MYSPGFPAVPSAAQDALGLLREVLVRCAAAGKLRVDPDTAAQAIMSANIGVALNLVTQPDTYTDPELSHRVRDAVHASLLNIEPAAPRSGADTGLATAALQLSAILQTQPTDLTAAETALLRQWLATLAASHPPTGM
jgi:hypothetical protein